MIPAEHLKEIQDACAGASVLIEGQQVFVHLPALLLPETCAPRQVEALLALSPHSGYPTRLFLGTSIQGPGNNWTSHTVLGRMWRTWSWNYVPSSLRPAEILAEHLRGLR